MEKYIEMCIIKNLLTIFFQSGFFSQTLRIRRTAKERKRPSFIPLYHFHPLTNIQTFICNFAREMTITCIYKTATRGDLSPCGVTIWLIDDVTLIFVYLLVHLILGFVTAILYERDSNSHGLSFLYYKGTD